MKVWPLLTWIIAGVGHPVHRVVQLLEDLGKKLEGDKAAEEEIYQRYRCWAETVEKTKTVSIAKAEARTQQLEIYLKDLGRTELTGERVRLEKQIATLKKDLEVIENNRERQVKSFEEEDTELTQATKALGTAVDVLSSATSEKQMLAAVKYELRSVAAFGEVRSALRELADPDWKQLNRKARFKGKYNPRSKKLLQLMTKLKESFEKKHTDLKSKEEENKKSYETLKESKTGELTTAVEAKNLMSEENAARGLAKTDAENEIAALGEAITTDQGLIKDAVDGLAKKTKEFDERTKARVGEIAAISEAVSVLRSDDARDTFSAMSFLEAPSLSRDMLRLAARTRDLRLLEIQKMLEPFDIAGKFTVVVSAIDTLVTTLEEEAETDLTNKESCESERTTQSETAKEAAKAVDTAHSKIDSANQDIQQKDESIAELNEDIKNVQSQIDAATKIRGEENAKYKKTKALDEEAKRLVNQAYRIMSAKYKEFKFMQAGPETWGEDGYKGAAAGESTVTLLEKIEKDIADDIASADKEEEESKADFEKLEKDLGKDIEDKNKAITKFEEEQATQRELITTEKTESETQRDTLDSAVDMMKSLQKGCDFIAVNFDTRKATRQAEIDGLKKAKTVLESRTSLLQRQ